MNVIDFVLLAPCFALGEIYRGAWRMAGNSQQKIAIPQTYLNSTLIVFFVFVFK